MWEDDDDRGPERVLIQVQMPTGNWQTMRTTQMFSGGINWQYIQRQMEFVKRYYPKAAVRAVTNYDQFLGMI